MISDAQSGRVIAVDWYLVGKTEDTRGEGYISKEVRSIGQCPRQGMELGSVA